MAQLLLGLEEGIVLPWGGRSPRSLTRVRQGLTSVDLSLFSRREPQKDDRFLVDPDQYDLFRAAIPGRRRYGGAPMLLPLP